MFSPRRRSRLAALALTLVACASVSFVVTATASAAAKPKIRVARFRATVKGLQLNRWRSTQRESFTCGVNADGSGTERIRFRSRRRVRVRITQIGRRGIPLVTIRGGDIDAKGTVARQGFSRSAPATSTPCADGGGGGGAPRPPVPDCGTKRFGLLPLSIAFTGRRRIGLTNSLLTPLVEPFKNCPSGGTAFPDILETRTNGRRITAELPPGEIFNRRLGRIIVLGRGKQTQSSSYSTSNSSGSSSSVTRIRWEINLRRIRSRRGR